jgi:transglutaminase-like putative cysteine protease
MAVFKIHHITKYQYDSLVRESINEIRIFPYHCPEQEMLLHQLNITEHPTVYTFSDYWGNTAGSFNLLGLHKELTIESKLTVRTTSPEVPEINETSGFEELEKDKESQLHMIELTTPGQVEDVEAMEAIAGSINDRSKSIAQLVRESCDYIFNNFQYIKGITTIETTVDEILKHRSGVCQDFAHVLLQILRTMDIPSRYVSGYICPNKNGMRGEGATHAWVEAWIPNYGWAGIDPTNNVWVTNKHVKLAVGRDFKDCSPIKGTFKGQAEQKLTVFVSVGYEDGVTFEEMNDVSRIHLREREALAERQQQQ